MQRFNKTEDLGIKDSLAFIISDGERKGNIYNLTWAREREMTPFYYTKEDFKKHGIAGSFAIDSIKSPLISKDFSILQVMTLKEDVRTAFFYDVELIRNGEFVKRSGSSFKKLGVYQEYTFICKWDNYKAYGYDKYK
jgi:hypothetical protein